MKRIHSIDFIRGLVMLIMALDHVRDLYHVDVLTQDPTNMQTTTPILFFTRWITHLCAPTFVFLSGTSAYLSLQNQGNLTESKRFLLKRGVWLIMLEFTVVGFAIWFDLYFRTFMSQVIAAIGFGFVLLSFLLKIPAKTLGYIGLAIIFTHNLSALINFGEHPAARFLSSYFLTTGFFPISPQFTFLVNYPIIPWFGIMLAGFGFGTLIMRPDVNHKTLYLKIGLGALLLFTLIRFINYYGDPAPWSAQKNAVYTFMSFINTTKYPPSLLYTLMTLGVIFLVFALTEGVRNRFVEIVSVYGKVPLFYYILHWYIIHSFMVILMLLQGHPWAELNFGSFGFGRPQNGGGGVELGWVYVIWLVVIALLYPACQWYTRYKATHQAQKWWLRYL